MKKPASLCPKCKAELRRRPGGLGPNCEAAQRRLERAAKQKSPLRYETDKLSAQDEYIGDRKLGATYKRQQKQEYSRKMAHTAELLEQLAQAPTAEGLASYVSDLAEDERRWLGRRGARVAAIGHAREVLLTRLFEAAAQRVTWKLNPTGYARKHHNRGAGKRILNSVNTDQHVGYRSPKEESPEPYDLTSSARSIAQVILQTVDYKPQYREQTSCNLLFGGDGFEGALGHGPYGDNYTLTEQMVAYAAYKAAQISRVAEAFPEVHVWDVPGNHGRNKLVHQGRATSSKWDNFETVVSLFVKQQCEPLKNVTFHVGKAPAVVIPLFDKRMLFTHADTELKLGSPSRDAASWERALNAVNGDLRYGCFIDLLVGGHFHDPRLMVFTKTQAISNGSLVPANGYARTLGFASVVGQWLFESVPGFPVGDARFVRVDHQSTDASLDSLVKPYVWEGA